MTPEQRTAVEILNKIRDFMGEKLSDDDYMYLMGMIFPQRTDVLYVPQYPVFPTFPQVTWQSTNQTNNEE